MSLGEADSKFPDSIGGGLPPSPSRENPGQVFPKSDPSPAPPSEEPAVRNQQYNGNPFIIETALKKLDTAIEEVIHLLEKEGMAVGGSAENSFVQKLRGWKIEVERTRAGQADHKGPSTGVRPQPKDIPPKREGGMFTD